MFDLSRRKVCSQGNPDDDRYLKPGALLCAYTESVLRFSMRNKVGRVVSEGRKFSASLFWQGS